MSLKIVIRRGLKVHLSTLAEGEFGLCNDTSELYIGTPNGNKLLKNVEGIESIDQLITNIRVYILQEINELAEKFRLYEEKTENLYISDFEIMIIDSTTEEKIMVDSKLVQSYKKGLQEDISEVSAHSLVYNDTSSNAFKTQEVLAGCVTLADFPLQSVKRLMPYDVTNLIVADTNRTNLTLSWTASQSADVKNYNIYVGTSLIGTTTATTFMATNLTPSTNYSITVKSQNGGEIEGYGTTINTRTLGNLSYTKLANTDYVEVPSISFTSIELTVKFLTLKNAWTNVIVESLKSNPTYNLYSQFNGTQYARLGFGDMYVDGVLKPDRNYATIPENTKVVIRLDTLGETLITDKWNIFASRSGTSVIRGNIYRVKFYKTDDQGKRVLVSDYDFSSQVTGSKLNDLMDNNEPMTLHGGAFSANQ
ncbi:fibronectin type III domain-containing protein [Priestia aryabhattai]|uniref:fibronectin type III domain-containing protein n=1 Tax=Priestia TaxID=2800373 RepID=UPI002E1FE499|nr:fibronectin type III domain-containing protein [Priestia aryabhattai]MED3951876.1 fibronectin type III domain-containing protein [Priestia aryabhattai]MED4393760.1 fibronectin type III domain-containing protein [Priestia aryabhattai]